MIESEIVFSYIYINFLIFLAPAVGSSIPEGHYSTLTHDSYMWKCEETRHSTHVSKIFLL